MSWNLHTDKRKTKSYVSLKKNRRVGNTVRSTYIYLGSLEQAVKIMSDLQIKSLIDEKEVSYSGEIILEKIANSVNMSKVFEKYTTDKRVAEVLKNIVILRTLFTDSKRKLINVRLEHSILKGSTDLRYLGEVYRFMDKIYDGIGDLVYDITKNAVKNYSLDLEYLIIDATRIKIWKDKETGLVRFGYSSKNERKNLPQANLILGVNRQQVPLFANIYSGNTSDVTMFHDFIDRITTRYKELSKHIKEKFIIFDQGNVNESNIEHLRALKEQGIYFVTMVKTNTASRIVKKVDKSSLPLIYSKETSENVKTEIYGEIFEEVIYDKLSRVLVCYNSDLREQKCTTLDRKVETIEQMVKNGINLDDIKAKISKYSLKQALKLDENEGKLALTINNINLDNRKKRYGFFALFTEHPDLSAKTIIQIYKSRGLVEEGFRTLKSGLSIAPVFHSKDMRIETHIVLVVLCDFLLALLRAILMEKNINHPFEALKDIIKSGNAVEGFYNHENLDKTLYIWRPIKLEKELEEIFKALKIKKPTFDIEEVIPTNMSIK